MFPTVDFSYDQKLDNAIDQLLNGNEDEKDDDWLANYIYSFPMKKRDYPLITQVCCRRPCAIYTLVQYCPLKNQ